MKKIKIIFSFLFIFIISTASHKLMAQENKPKKGFTRFIENQLSLLGGMNLSNQDILAGNYNSKFNYNLKDYQNNGFKAGYFIGFRVDSKHTQKNYFDFSVSFNKINSGTNYKAIKSLAPFSGSFSSFKADDQFFMLHLNTHYKKQILSSVTNNRKFYVIAGPSVDIRLSDQTEDNKVYSIYHTLLLKADIGVEFENQTNYTFFVHYKQPLSSFTKSPINTHLNTIEIGSTIKVSALF